jgi:hypothetical protein
MRLQIWKLSNHSFLNTKIITKSATTGTVAVTIDFEHVII